MRASPRRRRIPAGALRFPRSLVYVSLDSVRCGRFGANSADPVFFIEHTFMCLVSTPPGWRHCVLGLIGATEGGTRELIISCYSTVIAKALNPGVNCLGSSSAWGLSAAPKLAIGEGSLGFWIAMQDDGLQAWSGSPKASAPAAGLGTDPKGRYRRSFCRWRETNPKSLIDHLPRIGPFPDTQLLTISQNLPSRSPQAQELVTP